MHLCNRDDKYQLFYLNRWIVTLLRSLIMSIATTLYGHIQFRLLGLFMLKEILKEFLPLICWENMMLRWNINFIHCLLCSQQYNLDITDGNQVLLISHVKRRVPAGVPPPGPAMLIPELCYLTGYWILFVFFLTVLLSIQTNPLTLKAQGFSCSIWVTHTGEHVNTESYTRSISCVATLNVTWKSELSVYSLQSL